MHLAGGRGSDPANIGQSQNLDPASQLENPSSSTVDPNTAEGIPSHGTPRDVGTRAVGLSLGRDDHGSTKRPKTRNTMRKLDLSEASDEEQMGLYISSGLELRGPL